MDASNATIQCHYCQNESCFDDIEEFCFSKSGKCYTTIDLHHSSHQRGCVDIMNKLFCFKSITNYKDAHFQCCESNLCNNETFVSFNNNVEPVEVSKSDYILYTTSILFILLAIFGYFYYKYLGKKKNIYKETCMDTQGNVTDNFTIHFENDKHKHRHLYLSEITSGSGSGTTVLSKRSFANAIEISECVGKGRYGQVWKGKFRYEDVAVKKFLSTDEASYRREIEIYSTALYNHDNILRYIGSDVTSKNSCTELWLVTAYHELGSLFDYLNRNTINIDNMISIMISICNGLVHLHTEYFGTKKKPAIAHRDIKSKNILMKTPGICCISDFGLAVTREKSGHLNISSNYRVGTKRYMAPEILNGTFNAQDFDSYTKADLYSFSLVLWEIIRRLESDNQNALTYEVPYQYKVHPDPSFEDMRRVVCTEQYRPEFSPDLKNHKIPLTPLFDIIQETWVGNPSCRSSAPRMKKSLFAVQKIIQMPVLAE